MKDNYPFHAKSYLNDEELNIAEVMNTSYYIFMEEHYNSDKYDYSVMAK